MSKKLRLSQSSTVMLNDVLEEMQSYNFDSVNFPLLLYGILCVTDEDNEINVLSSYISSTDILYVNVEDSASMFISDYCHKLQSDYEQENEKDNAFASTGNSTVASIEFSDSKLNSKIPMKSDIAGTIRFVDYTGKNFNIPANKEIMEIHEKLLEISQNYSVSEIKITHFVVAMFMINNKAFKNFFRELDISYLEAKKFFNPERILKVGCIPLMLNGFLSTLNDKIDASKPCEILMRDEETESLWNIMLKKNKRNAVIVGEAGVGKTAIIEKITYDISSGKCPKEFEKFKVISLDVNALIAGTSYRGDAEERIKEVISFLETNHNVILFIDEVHTILGAGSCFEGEMDLANALKPILARGETIVIGATTNEEYEKYFIKDAALSRRFEKLTVKEPTAKDVYPMIKNKLKALSHFHKVQIRQSMVEYAIMIASCFAFEKKNPDKTLDLIDRAMVTAKRTNKKFVDKESILKNFGIFFKKWNSMSEDSKKEVAYHEAGHYVVGKASGRLIDCNFLAVSIMPAENYLGVTVTEDNDEKIPFCNLDYYIDSIAFDLGGRVSENYFRGSYTSGASADLESATQIAFKVVTKLGMGSDAIKNRIYLNTENYPMFSEKYTDLINEEVNKLIEKGFERATQILEENRDILEAIVSALLKNYIMSESELQKVWDKVVSKRNK